MTRLPYILLSCLLTSALAGCVTVKIGQRDVLITNDDVARHGWKMSGEPTGQARLEPDRRVTYAKLKADFGNIHTATIEGRPDAPLIVFCGGNAFREAYAGAARGGALAPYGDVLLFDYPGLGLSDGSGSRADFAAARAALVGEIKRRTPDGRPLIFWGHSLGGGFCAALAADTNARATIVLEGAFAQYDDVADAKAGVLAPFVRLRVADSAVRYDIPALLKDRPGPVIVIASRADKTIKFSAPQRLAKRLKAQGRTVEFVTLSNAEHSRLFDDPRYDPQVRAALNAVAR